MEVDEHEPSGIGHGADDGTFTRKLERRIVALIETEEHVNEAGLRYINRLSDYFFTVACLINIRMGITETNYLRSDVIFK